MTSATLAVPAGSRAHPARAAFSRDGDENPRAPKARDDQAPALFYFASRVAREKAAMLQAARP